MRLLLSLTLAAGALFAATGAEAQTYDPRFPVCMHVYTGGRGGGGDYFDCSFASIPQCQATASGRSASCDINPYYAFANEPPPPRRRHKRVYD